MITSEEAVKLSNESQIVKDEIDFISLNIQASSQRGDRSIKVYLDYYHCIPRVPVPKVAVDVITNHLKQHGYLVEKLPHDSGLDCVFKISW